MESMLSGLKHPVRPSTEITGCPCVIDAGVLKISAIHA